jgi:hypothetical protein
LGVSVQVVLASSVAEAQQAAPFRFRVLRAA